MRARPPLKQNSATPWNAACVSAAVLTDQSQRPLRIAVALMLLRGYKLLISPIFAGSCRFVPSCADYAAEAIDRHGLLSGSWLTLRRLGRCQPYCQGGHDPVPTSK